MFTSIYMYLHICTYLHVFTYIYIYLQIFTDIYIDLHMFTYIFIYLHMFTYVYIYLHIFTYIYIYLHIFTYIYIYLHILTYAHIYIYLSDLNIFFPIWDLQLLRYTCASGTGTYASHANLDASGVFPLPVPWRTFLDEGCVGFEHVSSQQVGIHN